MVAKILPAQIENLSVSRRGKTLLGPVDLHLGGTGLTVVMGPNGSGKTTFLRALHGVQRLTTGKIHWSAPDPHLHQAFVFQKPVMMRRNVLDNIAYPLRLGGMGRGAARSRAALAAEMAGLGHMLDRPAHYLSGGEQQKLALARAMILSPQLLILDEPSASLDPRATREIEALLIGIRDQGTRILMSTHDQGQARRLADDVILLHAGRVAEQSPRQIFFDAPASKEAQAYLSGEILI